MDNLLAYIVKNRDWLFSGAGVFIVAFIMKVAWNRFHPGKPVIQSAPSLPGKKTEPTKNTPTNVSATDYTAIKVKRAYIVKRVHIGDYIDISDNTHRNIRICVKEITDLDVPHDFFDDKEREDAIALSVDTGGEIFYCGTKAKKTGVNAFLVPKLEVPEPSRSVFSFGSTKDRGNILSIGVEHINRPAGTVDLKIFHMWGPVR